MTEIISKPDLAAATAWDLEYTLANFATSRGPVFLKRVSFPWRGHEEAVCDALTGQFRAAMRADAPLREERGPLDGLKFQASVAEAVGDAAAANDIMEWFRALPVGGGDSPHSCAFYWNSVFFFTLGTDAAGIDGVRDALWRAFVAAIQRKRYESSLAYADTHTAYIAETDGIERLQREIQDWQRGPFTDWDLEMAEAYEWDVGDGLIWCDWETILDYQRITTLWRLFAPHFSKAELDALVAWKSGHAQEALEEQVTDPELASLLMDPMMADMRREDAGNTPPCHPNGILVSDA